MEDFFKFFGRFFKIKVKIIKYRLHLNVWNLQSGKMIMETECARFSKIGGFFKNFERFFVKLILKSSKYSTHRCMEGAKSLPIPNSGKAARG